MAPRTVGARQTQKIQFLKNNVCGYLILDDDHVPLSKRIEMIGVYSNEANVVNSLALYIILNYYLDKVDNVEAFEMKTLKKDIELFKLCKMHSDLFDSKWTYRIEQHF